MSGGKLSPEDISMLANSPRGVAEAYNTLVESGVDAAALVRLIRRRALPTGRPGNSEAMARLEFSVRCFMDEHPETKNTKAAIRGVLAALPDFAQMKGAAKRKKLNSLAVALSRHRKRLK